MGKNYAILGAGRQGTAVAYDIALFGDASRILLLDYDAGQAERAAGRVNQLSKTKLAQPGTVDVKNYDALVSALKGTDAFLSAVPYYFNPLVSKAAVAAGASMCDLGGNTDIVWEQHKLHAEAKNAGITIIPDCGLMPGMGNTLAAYAMEKMDACHDIHVRCGGLPQNPKPPLLYKLVFSIHGLINEYFGKAHLLRDGGLIEIPTFTELEKIEFPPPVGKCEAFTTTGGTSTAPWTFQGKVKNYDYKTVRYPGHYEKFKTLLELGFLDDAPEDASQMSPRQFSAKILIPKMDFPEDRDLVVLRVTARGVTNGKRVEINLDVMDFHDEKTGFTAMERTTGYPAAIVAIYLAHGKCEKGVVPLEKGIPGAWFVSELEKRGIPLVETQSVLS